MPKIRNYEESVIILAIRERVQEVIDPLFSNYLEYDIYAGNADIEVKVQRTDNKDEKTTVLRLIADHANRKIGVTNIFIPQHLLQHGHGKAIIAKIFSATSAAGYDLLLHDVMPGFHRRLANRGATVIDEETIQITDATRLTS